MSTKEEFIKQIHNEYMSAPWNDKHEIQRQIEKQEQEVWIDQVKKMMEYEKKRQDPIEILRDEMRGELNDIKKAIHTIGILLDGDKPTDEMLEKHKMLREAYRKYKMIEALILGQQK